jgi:hypothetical protein
VNRPSLVTVLAEDERHVRFVHRYLRRLGYTNHEIRIEPLPSGRGCGEQWVRERYAQAVKAFRSRAARARSALVVAIDADTEPVSRRLQQFRESLRLVQQPDRDDAEAIAHLIPKRSIETWLLCLTGKDVDEDTDYRREANVDDLIRPAAEKFFDWSRPNVVPPARCVDSLLLAIQETRRLE